MNTQKISELTSGELIIHIRYALEKAEKSWVEGNLRNTHGLLFNISQMSNWAAEKVHNQISNSFNETSKNLVKNPGVNITSIKPKSDIPHVESNILGITPACYVPRVKLTRNKVAWKPNQTSPIFNAPNPKKWETVVSSNIKAIKYDHDAEILMIEFKDSHIYKYERVPSTVYLGLVLSESKGKFFHSQIKGKYPCERINS